MTLTRIISVAALGAFVNSTACSGGQVAVGDEFTPDAGSSGTSGSSGTASGSTSGTASGTTSGTASGTASGSASGSVSGSATGSSGSAAGSVSGSASGSVSGSSSGSSSGSTSGSGGLDAGTCCPSGWQSYACTYPDGGEGTACHNPALGCASSLTCGQGCDPVATSCSPSVDAGPPLRWWATCGYPICAAPGASDDGGSPADGTACPALGTACSTAGDTCGTKSAANCGVIQECSATDPTKGPGGCPISSRKFKENIHYVDDPELELLHDEALHIRLATYNYQSQFEDPNQRHLGFVVEDDPRSPAVDRSFDRVDMYGYVSMLVATMQVQEKEIAELRRELAESRGGVCAAPSEP